MGILDISDRLAGSSADTPVPFTIADVTSAGKLSEHWIDLLKGIRSQDTKPASLGAGTELTATMTITTAAASATANATLTFMVVAIPRTALTGLTFTAATTDIVTAAAHGFPNGTCVTVSSGTTLPAGLAASTHYYVRDATTDTFKLSLTPTGAAVDITDTGTGTHTVTFVPQAIASSGPVPLKRLAAGDAVSIRLNPLQFSSVMPRQRYLFGYWVSSANLSAGLCIVDLHAQPSTEKTFYPSGWTV